MIQTTHKLKKSEPLNLLNSGLHLFGTSAFLMAPDLLTSALIHKQWVPETSGKMFPIKRTGSAASEGGD